VTARASVHPSPSSSRSRESVVRFRARKGCGLRPLETTPRNGPLRRPLETSPRDCPSRRSLETALFDGRSRRRLETATREARRVPRTVAWAVAWMVPRRFLGRSLGQSFGQFHWTVPLEGPSTVPRRSSATAPWTVDGAVRSLNGFGFTRNPRVGFAGFARFGRPVDPLVWPWHKPEPDGRAGW
jgi:hypothetical protein